MVDFAVFDVALGEGLDAEVHGGVVADGADDEVDVGEDAVGVGGVVVDEESAWGFEDADAASAFDGEGGHDVGAGDVGVGEEFFGAFDGVEGFDHAGVVVEEGVVRGVAELGAEFGEFFVGFRCADFVGDVEAGEGSDAVDAFGPAVGEVEGEFEVAVVFDVFADVFEIVFDGIFGKAFAVAVDHADGSIVEFEVAVVDEANVASFEFVEDFDLSKKGLNDWIELMEEVVGFFVPFEHLVAFFFAEGFGDAACL